VVAAALGHDRLVALCGSFPAGVARALEFANAVLVGRLSGPLAAAKLDRFIGDFEIIRELRLPFDPARVKTLANAMAGPGVVDKLGYANAPALAATAAALLSREPWHFRSSRPQSRFDCNDDGLGVSAVGSVAVRANGPLQAAPQRFGCTTPHRRSIKGMRGLSGDSPSPPQSFSSQAICRMFDIESKPRRKVARHE
jgi:hypothetical protein